MLSVIQTHLSEKLNLQAKYKDMSVGGVRIFAQY